MRKISIMLFLLLPVIVGIAGEISMPTKVQSVTLYHTGALVSRVGQTELNVGINEIIFKNLSSKIVLNSLKVSNKEVTVLNKSIIRKLTKEEYSQLVDRKDALSKQMELIESKFNEVGFVSEVEDLQKLTNFYSEKILAIKKDLRQVNQELEDAAKIENIKLENENAAILKLIVSVEKQMEKNLNLQYVCGGIGWSPAYEISVDKSSQASIEVKFLAKAMSQTGEDWNDITLHLSSSFPLDSPTELPKPESPWTLSGGRNYYLNGGNNESQNVGEEQQSIDKLDGIEYQEITIPSFLKVRTLAGKYSIKSNSTVFTFPIQSVNLPTNYYYYGYPGLDPEAYLVAQITDWDTLGFVDGIASITFNGNNIGKSIVKFSESKDTLLLPVGKDNSVYLMRKEIADQKYFKEAIIGKKKTTTHAYRYELKNNNGFPVKFELMDQVPIAQTKSAEVTIEQKSSGALDEETGEITWSIELQPGESRQRELIFTIETDANYSYYNGKARAKYRRVSMAKF